MMSEVKNVLVSREDSVFLIVIDRPPTNALDLHTLSELNSALDEFAGDPACLAAIIASANRTVFSSGADLRAFAKTTEPGKIENFVSRGQTLFSKISACSKPVLAAIEGLALGGGLELALACHLRIVSERARLGLPEINLGLIPGWGGTQRLKRLVGRAKATEMILLGESISAQEALRLNLVNKVVARDELLPAAKDLARKIAGKDGRAVRAAMDSIGAAVDENLADGLAFEARQIATLANTEEAQKKIAGFLERHKPGKNRIIPTI